VQRPTERVGGVYTYQAIPSGAILRCELTVPREWVRQARPCPQGRVRQSPGPRRTP
jgi:hypothetical protein